MESSQGYLRVRLPHALVYCGLGLTPAAVIASTLGFVASWLMRLTHVQSPVIVADLTLGFALALLLHALLWCLSLRTPLAVQREGFQQSLRQQHPGMQRCPSGSGRAISAKQLSDFFEYFQGFIRGRDMYFVDSNIVRPLTATCQLSYSEMVGPRVVSWFVSHYWGSSFQHFVAAVLQHAHSCPDWWGAPGLEGRM